MKKTLKIIKTVLSWAVVAMAIVMVIFTVFAVTTLDRYDRNLLGWKFLIVTSDSMSKTDFDAGDLIFVKSLEDPSILKEGDIISYRSTNSDNFGGIVTHKIRRLSEDAKGNPGFVTYGTTTDTDDEKIVLYENIIGLYRGRISKLGHFFAFLRTPIGYIFCILTPFAILIAMQGVQALNIFREHKKTERELLDEEWAKLRKEQEKSAKMLSDLQKMTRHLEKKLAQTEEKNE